MLFTSYTFLFLFLPLVVLAHHFAPARLRNPVLLLASYVFYAWWRVDFVLLLVASAIIDYSCGRRIHAAQDQAAKRRFVALSVVTNLSLLGYFKYANWGIDNLNGLLGGSAIPWAEVVLPVGVSFFTFQTMSYSIDVYRGDAEPASSFLDFSTYVAMFPQLVAGPIVRYRTVAAELAGRERDPKLFARGTLLFMVGFSKKILLANNCGLVADAVFDPGPTGFGAAWLQVSVRENSISGVAGETEAQRSPTTSTKRSSKTGSPVPMLPLLADFNPLGPRFLRPIKPKAQRATEGARALRCSEPGRAPRPEALRAAKESPSKRRAIPCPGGFTVFSD